MASSINILISPPYSRYSFSSRNSLFFSPSIPSLRRTLPSKSLSISASASASSTRALEALIFDCDGVILESEHLHRQAYNDAFAHFNVRCPSDDDDKPLNWSLEFYDVLQNQIGGGKPKMRCIPILSRIGLTTGFEEMGISFPFKSSYVSLCSCEIPRNGQVWKGGDEKHNFCNNNRHTPLSIMDQYFKEHGWPTSTIFQNPPEDDSDRAKLIDTLQDWKTERYKDIIKSGTVKPRPGVLRLMDEAKASGKLLAVCSAATKSSVILCLENLIGLDRFHGLDCFLAGDDVKEKKPDPSIYITAVKKLGVSESNCLVVEDSVIGLQAAVGAGMSCVITYTSSTADQDFKEAIAIYPDLSDVRFSDLESLLQDVVVTK